MFPFADYEAVLREARGLVEDRDRKGRNAAMPFYATRCHGAQDVTGEIYQRITRILGAELAHDQVTARQDAIDLVNEAIFLVMFLDHASESPGAEVCSP
ncbi:MAG: hypothetical protein ACRCZI_13990 [Cetobacterium sp.]